MLLILPAYLVGSSPQAGMPDWDQRDVQGDPCLNTSTTRSPLDLSFAMCSAHVLALPLDADVRSHRVDQEAEHQKGESGRGCVVLHAEIAAVALEVHAR